MVSIINSLGYGSGIDTQALIADLAAASRAPKAKLYDARATANQARISAVAQARASLDEFATSLAALASGGTLQSQPTTSDATIVTAVAVPGARLENFSADIRVTRLARGQVSHSAIVASASTTIAQGTLTLSVNGTSYPVVVDASNNTLGGLAAAFNATNSGVRASLVGDTGGVRLVLKGETGAAKAFTITGNPAAFNSTNLTRVQTSLDAQLNVDGLNLVRASNTVSDIIAGVTLTLVKAATSTTITLGAKRPADTLKSTLGDFVSVYNQLRTDISAARSATGGDAALRGIERQLGAILGQPVTSRGGIDTLAEIGISTNGDGTIALDAAKFDAAFAANPDAVEAIFAPTRDATRTATTDPGIAGALTALRDAAARSGGPLEGLKARLSTEASGIAKDRERMETREAAYKDRLTRQYAGLDARLSAFKATQSYLEQQVKLWSSDNR